MILVPLWCNNHNHTTIWGQCETHEPWGDISYPNHKLCVTANLLIFYWILLFLYIINVKIHSCGYKGLSMPVLFYLAKIYNLDFWVLNNVLGSYLQLWTLHNIVFICGLLSILSTNFLITSTLANWTHMFTFPNAMEFSLCYSASRFKLPDSWSGKLGS